MPLMKTDKKLIFILLLVFVISIVYISNTKDKEINLDNPTTVNVYPGDSIQQAIRSAKSGDTIIVYPGSYKENIVVDKSLSIISKSREPTNTIIQAANTGKDIFHVTADYVTISGFNVTGAKNKAGIFYSGTEGNIVGNKFISNEYGILLKKSSNISIENNAIFQNQYGIYLKNSNNNWLNRNNISNTELTVDINGIKLADSNNNKLIKNTVLNNWQGVYLSDSSDNELNKNLISANYFSIRLENSNNNKLLNNTVNLNKYTYSVTLESSQNNLLKGNSAGLNTKIKVIYNSSGSKNNTLEGEQYIVNGQGRVIAVGSSLETENTT